VIVANDTARNFDFGGGGDLADQLRRASTSIVLNIAEGAGEYRPVEKARFYRMSLRSATECAAIVDIATHLSGGRLTRFDGDNAFIDVGREMRKSLLRIVAMLTRMASIGQNRGRGRERDRER
jgi:four helix bundle protein